MAEEHAAPERPVHDQLLEENRRLAQRYLELEESARRQLDKLRLANSVLARGEADMRLLLENADIGFALLDLNLRVVSVNQTLCSLLGYFENELPGENFNNFVYVGKLPIFSRMTGQSAGRGRGRAAIDLVARDGHLVPCQVAVSDWLNEEGAVLGTFLLVFGVGEEKRSEAKLRDLEEAMAGVEKSRAFFLDVVARELRTPASGIMGMIRMLMDTELGERQAELAGVIHSSASSLVRLVDDIVDVSGAEPGSGDGPAPLYPAELLRNAANLFGVRAEEKGLEIRVNVSPAVPERIVGDARRLRRVLTHLLDNALKFTDHGHVALSLDVIGDNLRFMVSDTGQGLRPEPGRDIFGDEVGEDSPEARRHGGIGVGLSVCRRLVAAMGGKIGYESEPGRGSEFHFTVPLQAALAGSGEEAKLEPPPEAIRLAPLRILLADGNPLGRRVVEAYLRFDGHALTLADNGLDAAAKCRGKAFDLVILDLHLPKIDGLQALRLIRDEELAAGRARVPVLLLAPPGRLRDAEQVGRAGGDGVVAKPVQPVALMAAIAGAAGVKPLGVARVRAPAQYAAESSGASIRRLDGVQLVNLRQATPGDQFLGILRFFMEDAVPGIIGLREMADREDPDHERIAFAASKARGLAGYLGFAALADLLKRLEEAGRTGAEPERLRSLAVELPMVTDDSLEELKRIMPEAFATISAMAGPIADEAGD